jgi:uncharacterized protein YhaN
LLPQAENERDQLKNQLSTLHNLKNQAEQIRGQQSALEMRIAELENHADALRYAAAANGAEKIKEAEETMRQSKERLSAMMSVCQSLPTREEAQRKLQQAQALQEEHMALQMEEKMLPPLPEKPVLPEFYQGVEAAQQDTQKKAALERRKKSNAVILGILGAIAAVLLLLILPFGQYGLYFGLAAGIFFVTGAVIFGLRSKRINEQLQQLTSRYGDISADRWIPEAQRCADTQSHYEALLANGQALQEDLCSRSAALQEKIRALTGDTPLEKCQNQWANTTAAWDALGDARRDLQRNENHVQTLRSMFKPAQPPKKEDHLTYSEEENQVLLSDARLRQRQLHVQLGQCLGQTESLGSEALLKARLDTLNHRITRLEDTYYALEMAQDALRDATMQLQRRFAPRISKRAQELFGKLTGNRYQRLSLGQDLSLSVSAADEDTLRGAQWRSDGTADQLYLALRLAVAEELTPEAPLVLDDAFVRFDDLRLKAAMKILKEESETKQVILFTCQSREKTLEETR